MRDLLGAEGRDFDGDDTWDVRVVTAGGVIFPLSSLFLLIFVLLPCYNPIELHS